MRGYENNCSNECVVFFHGFTGHKTETGCIFRKIADDLELINISSIRMDWFGHGESDYTFDQIRVPLLQEQAQVILDYAFNHYDKVHLLGFSMGGAFAIQSATNKLASLILMAPAINMAHIVHENFAKDATNTIADLSSFPLHIDFARGFEPLEYKTKVQAFTKPILIIHGVLDLAVPIEGSRMLSSLNPLVELVEIEKSGHLFNSLPFQKQVKDTIKKHLQSLQ